MIGQMKLKDQIGKMIDSGFPRFVIIAGGRHSGKQLLAKLIATKLQAQVVVSPIKVENVREVISLAYTINTPTLYIFPDADKMSSAAKNALLKVTEEPPKKAYFIMTFEDLSNCLETLKSRGTVLKMEPYTPQQLLEYAKGACYEVNQAEKDIISNVCSTPGDVDLIMGYNVEEFYAYCNTIVDNIGVVNGANAFKIGSKFHLKDDDGGWDIPLIFRAIMHIYLKKMHDSKVYNDTLKYFEGVRITGNYLNQLTITGINKASTVDMWILAMRGVFVE